MLLRRLLFFLFPRQYSLLSLTRLLPPSSSSFSPSPPFRLPPFSDKHFSRLLVMSHEDVLITLVDMLVSNISCLYQLIVFQVDLSVDSSRRMVLPFPVSFVAAPCFKAILHRLRFLARIPLQAEVESFMQSARRERA